jgi:TetR/AcrR family transcriptional regulator, mexJK operon transcriptional repressor
MEQPKTPDDASERPPAARVGRPRRGTEAERVDLLIAAATRVFLRDGYGAASIDKVAHEAGVSTRTIYERFKNKADLLTSVITRLVERDMVSLFGEELERLPPRQALLTIGETVTGRACAPEAAALFRIVAAEAQRFPALAAKMRAGTKARVNNAVANYLRQQVARGKLVLADPERAAALFMQMVCAELHECLLFGSPEEMSKLNFAAHLQQVVDIFLNGAAPRGASDLEDAR